MCGIAAIIDARITDESPEAVAHRDEQLARMLDRIRHRGDAECFAERLTRPGIALGTNRLAIVDRDHGRQPQSDTNGLVEVVFNGELYEHRALRKELERLGHKFRTKTDTEVLLVAYLEWGESFVGRLDGMYAFVLHDRRTGTFLAARDHIGIKPLYHVVSDGVHYFASEQKCLIGVTDAIEEVPPGTYLVNGQQPVRHFELRTDPPRCSEQEAVTRYRELLDNAVRRQTDTDLPVAVLFSGGIDSAAVLEAACRFHPAVTAFTVGYENSADVEVAQRYCAELGIPHVVSYLDQVVMAEIVPTVIQGAELFEEIDVMDSCVSYVGYRAVREHGFKVALCGEGSDEVLAGYALFKTHPEPDELMRYRTHNLYRTDLQRVDRMSMLHSVETRVPFLDRSLMEFGYRLPMSLKLRDGVEKWVLREACRGRLPVYIRDREKSRMSDGSGLTNGVMASARRVASADNSLADRLGIDTEEGRYFLREYLKAGFPAPRERSKRAGFDYPHSDHFEFIP
ncbi:asparagine synthase-related protein [Streptomyces sp. NPDC046727]|uniref:asparagine synthetase B family protein n=1 Tax=Streptomyces sp. NPDC046727 TaxID=3155373 RepID=UPI0033CAB261